VERRQAAHPGVVEHDRDPAHRLHRGIDGTGQPVRIGDIGHVGGSADLRGKFVSGVAVDVDDGHHRALIGHAARGGSSDARAASGDHGTLAFE